MGKKQLKLYGVDLREVEPPIRSSQQLGRLYRAQKKRKTGELPRYEEVVENGLKPTNYFLHSFFDPEFEEKKHLVVARYDNGKYAAYEIEGELYGKLDQLEKRGFSAVEVFASKVNSNLFESFDFEPQTVSFEFRSDFRGPHLVARDPFSGKPLRATFFEPEDCQQLGIASWSPDDINLLGQSTPEHNWIPWGSLEQPGNKEAR